MLRFALAALPLLAAALGGSVDRPGQGGLLLALGLVLLWRPPAVNALGRALAGVAGTLVGWAALPLVLPAAWFPGAAWRTALTEDLTIPLPGTLSPQPWLTGEAIVLLCAGLAWLWWAADAAGTLTDRQRRAAARWFVLGAAALGLTAVVCQRLGVQPPGWRQERGFGPFPNRNQFGNFLGLAALLALGGAHAAGRAGRWVRAGALAGALAVLAYAVFGNFSRAGVIILLGGAAVYAGGPALGARGIGKGTRRTLAPRLAIAVSLLALLLAGFLLVGGDTLARFTGGDARGTVNAVTGDFRWKVQGDALVMLRAMPFCGPGLGNFGALFPFFRDQTTTTTSRAVHPESDWLWLGTEMGWPALILAGIGVGLLAWRLRGGDDGSRRSPVRRAALVGLGAFLVHSLMEVSTHRMGTMFPAALLYALALPAAPPVSAGMMTPTRRRPTRWPFCLLGAGLMIVGAMWVHAAWTGSGRPPGKLASENLRRAGATALRDGNRAGAVALLSRAAAMMPLEWGTRLDLGVALLNVGRTDDAAAEFRRAQELEPLSPRVPVSEAFLWLAEGHHPEAALTAIEETFRRDPKTGEQAFTEALVHHGADPILSAGLEALGRREPRLDLAFLDYAPPGEVWPRLDGILADDPELTRYAADPVQLRRFLRQWARHGDPVEMAAAMAQHPAWQAVGWREWAEAVANGGDLAAACRVVERFARQPELPPILKKVDGGPGPEVLAGEFARAPGDFALGLRLFQAQMAADRRGEALRTLVLLSKLPGAPPYLAYLEARVRLANGDGAGAWEAWGRYLQASGQS